MREYRPSILLIEDNANLVSVLAKSIQPLNLDIKSSYSGKDGLRKALSNKYELFIIDLGLGDIHGFELIKKIREINSKPIIVITGNTLEDNEIYSYKLKANIYHRKPINYKILRAQITSLLTPVKRGPIILSQDISLNLNSRVLKSGNKTIPLTKSQFNFIAMLFNSNGQVFTRKQIVNNIMNYYSASSESCVDTMVSRIRKRLGEKNTKTSLIKTITGVGYKLNPEYYSDIKHYFPKELRKN